MPTIAGYRPGLSQPCIVISWTTIFRPAPRFDIIDDWLVNRLSIPRSCIEALPIDAVDPDSHLIWLLAGRVMLLSQALQEAAGIAIFDAGVVRRVVEGPPESGRWIITAWAPQADHLPEAALKFPVTAAIRAIDVMVDTAGDSLQAAQLMTSFERDLIPNLSKLAAQGKSVVPLLKAAHRRKIPVRHLPGNCIQLGLGKHSVILDRSTCDKDSARGKKLSADKTASAALLRQAGLPGAIHIEVQDLAAAIRAAHQLGWPLVVKPANRERGEGVKVGITNDTALRDAYAETIKVSPRVLIERQVSGICHRVFIASGKMLYVVRRMPIGFYGDGCRSVREIVETTTHHNNALPAWLRTSDLPLDDEARETLSVQDLTDESVAPAGMFVALRAIESSRWGGVDENFTSTIHPENIAIAERAARVLGLSNAGVDIMSTDITRPWYETGSIINEVNFSPLLGGGPISLTKIDEFLDLQFPGKERIPILTYAGGDAALTAAMTHQRALVAKGIQCYVTNHSATYNPGGQPIRLAGNPGLFERALALTMNRDVEAIVAVVQTDEWLWRGLPVDRLDRVVWVDGEIVFTNSGGFSAVEKKKALRQLLDQMKMNESSI